MIPLILASDVHKRLLSQLIKRAVSWSIKSPTNSIIDAYKMLKILNVLYVELDRILKEINVFSVQVKVVLDVRLEIHLTVRYA